MRRSLISRAVAPLAAFALVAAGTVIDAAPAEATSTVRTVEQLTTAFERAKPKPSTVVLGDAIESKDTILALPARAALTLDLKGRDLDLGSVALGVGAKLTITDSTRSADDAGRLTANALEMSYPEGQPESDRAKDIAGIETGDATLTITGTAKVTAIGGVDAPGIGAALGRSSGTITVQGKASVYAAGGRFSAGVGTGPNEGTVGRVRVAGDATLVADGGIGDYRSGAGIGGGYGRPGGVVQVLDRAWVVAQGGSIWEGAPSTVEIGAGVGGGGGASGGEVTIASGAQLVAGTSNAAVSASAVGQGDGGASFGALRNDGRLMLSGVLRVPAGAVITGSGSLQAGTVQNQGTILLPEAKVTSTISGNVYWLRFDPAGGRFGTSTEPRMIRVLAPTIAAAKRSIPVATRTGLRLASWSSSTLAGLTSQTVLSGHNTNFTANWKSAAALQAPVPGYDFGVLDAPKVGVQIDAVLGTWEPGALLRYQWLREGKAIKGATAAQYTPVAADLGKRLQLRVTPETAGYTTVPARMGARTAKVGSGTLAIGEPSVQLAAGGAVRVGSVVTVDPAAADWTPGTKFRYQWFIDDAAVKKATKASWTVPAAAAGRFVHVRVTGSATGYRAWNGAASFEQQLGFEDPVAAGVFTAAPTPSVTGTAQTGRTLTAVAGSWSPGATLRYQWLRDGVPVPGATKAKYTIPASAIGASYRVEVTGLRAGFETAWASSADTAPALGTLSAPTPKISGTARLGRTLQAVPGVWTMDAAVSYQWYRAGSAKGALVAIEGATGPSYLVTAADKGRFLAVAVSGSLAGYADAVKTSKRTGKVG